MNEESKGFKTALMGGFNREDVLRYIEQASKENAERVEALQQENETLCQEMQELKSRNEAFSQKNADLLERLGEMTLESEKIQAENEARTKETREAADALFKLCEQRDTLAAEKAALSEEVEFLQLRCTEYDETKDSLTEMELSAHRRAKEVEDRALFEAKRVRVQSAEVISALKKALEAVSTSYYDAAVQARRVSAENERLAEKLHGKMDAVMSLLDEVVIGELADGQPEAANRPRMQQVLDMLHEKEGE